jgi:hypothetical protein
MFDPRQTQQGLPQNRGEDRWQGTAFGRFDPQGVDAAAFCIVAHTVEQNSLAHATQTDEQQAFGRTTSPHPFGGNADCLEKFVTTRQFRGRGTGARCIRVRNRIHGRNLYRSYWIYNSRINLIINL